MTALDVRAGIVRAAGVDAAQRVIAVRQSDSAAARANPASTRRRQRGCRGLRDGVEPNGPPARSIGARTRVLHGSLACAMRRVPADADELVRMAFIDVVVKAPRRNSPPRARRSVVARGRSGAQSVAPDRRAFAY